MLGLPRPLAGAALVSSVGAARSAARTLVAEVADHGMRLAGLGRRAIRVTLAGLGWCAIGVALAGLGRCVIGVTLAGLGRCVIGVALAGLCRHAVGPLRRPGRQLGDFVGLHALTRGLVLDHF